MIRGGELSIQGRAIAASHSAFGSAIAARLALGLVITALVALTLVVAGERFTTELSADVINATGGLPSTSEWPLLNR